MKDKLKHHTISFKNALAGVLWGVKSQPNYKIHTALSTLALLGGFVFKISYEEWLSITVMIILGFVIETVNTAFEAATDAISSEWRRDIKIAKDLAAGAMLIFATGAFIIACIIFLPKIFWGS